jgi:hypothetical protein
MSRTMQWMMIAIAGVVLLAAASQAAHSPGAVCAAAKQKATGQKAVSRLKCYTKAMLANVAIDQSCLDKAETKFSDAITKAEAKGGCVNTGDATDLESAVDTFVGSVVTLTPASTTTTTTIPCGAIVGGFCWFRAANGANCDTTCAAAGRVYSDATRDYAGSNGTTANCGAVAAALETVRVGPADATSDGGYGCIDVEASGNGAVLRITAPPTDSTSAHDPGYRFCACQ